MNSANCSEPLIYRFISSARATQDLAGAAGSDHSYAVHGRADRSTGCGAVRGRIDWKYALGLELTDPGFDFSVLSEFRQRLIKGQKEQFLLDVLLDELKKHGWSKPGVNNGRNSTHVVASVRQLNRLEMMGETMRQALNELAEVDPDWLKTIAPSEWFTRYGPRMDGIRLPKEREQREAFMEVMGTDGIYLMSTLWETQREEGIVGTSGCENSPTNMDPAILDGIC